MRIAIPVTQGVLAAHFGHCERFALFDVEEPAGNITDRRQLDSPPHQPGLLPAWLAERGADMIIAGGMGQRAVGLFTSHGIRVLLGAPSVSPEDVVNQYLAGTLELGENVCDH